jgi:hypothetical protein
MPEMMHTGGRDMNDTPYSPKTRAERSSEGDLVAAGSPGRRRPAALLARLGPERQPAWDLAPAFADRTARNSLPSLSCPRHSAELNVTLENLGCGRRKSQQVELRWDQPLQ